MTVSPEQLKDDLAYVSGAVRRQERRLSPAPIYYLWASIIAIGFALPDFAPRATAAYWMVMGPLGGLVSFWIGWREGLRLGEWGTSAGWRHGAHWGLMMAVIFLSFLPAAVGKPVSAEQVLLIVGLGYMLAGVHLDRPLLYAGILMLGGYIALLLWPAPYVWTTTGVLVAAALAFAGWRSARGGHAAS